MTSPAHHEQTLREAGLRVTQQRVAVLDAVRRLPHADTDSLINAVRAETGDISHQAVYDVLKALTEAGLVRKIQPLGPGRALRGPGRRQPPPRRLPRAAARSPTSTARSARSPCLTASDSNGFVIDEAEVIYWGICPDCNAKPANESPDPRRRTERV